MGNVPDVREKQLNIRLSEEESSRLERVAAHFGLNAAGVIRMLLKKADDEITKRGAHRAMERILDREVGDHGELGDSLSFLVLIALKAHGPTADVAKALKHESTGKYSTQKIKSALAGLLKCELIEKTQDGYAITPKGKHLV